MIIGPKITNDGLVFGYDTGYGIVDNNTIDRYNLGEPTTNLLSSASQNFSDGWGWSGTPPATVNDMRLLSESLDNHPIYRLSNISGSDPNTYVDRYKMIQSFGSLVENDWYTFSFDFRVIQKSNVSNTGAANNSGWVWYTSNMTGNVNWYNYELNKWYRAKVTSQVDTDLLAIPRIDYDNSIVDISKMSFEKKSHSTPFTTTTRSVSGSLLDLTGNNIIDLSNVTFDSNSQIYFDGTGSYIDCGNNSVLDITNHITIEFVFKTSNITDIQRMITHQSTSGSFGLGFSLARYNSNRMLISYNNGNERIYMYSTNMGSDYYSNFTHCIYTYNGTEQNWYINGSNESGDNQFTQGFVAGSATSNLQIGRYAASRTDDFDGEMPIVKIYNISLTPQEVQQNFNSYKNRFNLP